MTPELNDLDNHVAENVGRLMSSGLSGPASPPASDASFSRLERRLVTRRRRVRGLQAMVAAATVLVAASVGYRTRGRWLPGDEVITFQVERGPAFAQAGPIEGGTDTRGAAVTFSDGTEIRMDPRARGRVLTVDGLGAQVELERGRAHVDVRHRPHARWIFRAGPFEVHVTGTAFSLGWDPETAHFDLHMESGAVSVSGPISGGEMVLRAGETMSVGLREPPPTTEATRGATSRDDERPPAPRTPPLDDERALLSSRRHGDGPAAAERGRFAKNWRDELSNGHADTVVEDARRRGLAHVLQSVSSEELAALADAARYVGNHDLARRALLTQRARFAGSVRAAHASFLLGRLEDEAMGDVAAALAWYDRYLAEAPAGPYASEALGRKMMALEGANRRDQAMAIAADYLRRFPTGSYAHAARVLVRMTSPPAERPSSTKP